MDDIPPSLLKSVALCFREKKMVCRWCFFGDRDLSEQDAGKLCGSGEHKWLKPIVVIPGMYGGWGLVESFILVCSLKDSYCEIEPHR